MQNERLISFSLLFFLFCSCFLFSLFEGPPDPNKTVFVRQSSTVVCTAGIAHSMTIEPRDEYNNLCIFGPGDKPTKGYDVNIIQASDFLIDID